MIRNRYNRIPHPALNTKRERDTYNYDSTKIITAQVKSQWDSAFPTYGHKHAIYMYIVYVCRSDNTLYFQ